MFNSNIVIFGRAARKELMIAEGKLLERDKLLFPFSSWWQPANGKTKTYYLFHRLSALMPSSKVDVLAYYLADKSSAGFVSKHLFGIFICCMVFAFSVK